MHSSPLSARSTFISVCLRRFSMTKRFISISSTTRTFASGALKRTLYFFLPSILFLRKSTLPICFSEITFCLSFNEKSDPTPYSLVTNMSPPMRFESCFDILRPKPVPSIFLFCSRSKRSKRPYILRRSSSLIPLPVSFTEKVISA